MTQQEPSPVPPSDSKSFSSPSPVPPTTPTPPPSASVYKSLYHWAPAALLNETSSFTSFASISAYRKKQTCHKSSVFGKDHDKFVRMVACREGDPVCADEFELRLPFTPFERALLTEVNITSAQLHPNSWAFVRAFAILCHCLGHTPSTDVFLFFFEAKSPSKKLWVSFNDVAGRVLLTLFQQSYKGFKKHFF